MAKQRTYLYLLLGSIFLSHTVVTAGNQYTYSLEEQRKVAERYQEQMRLLVVHFISAHQGNLPEEATNVHSAIMSLSYKAIKYAENVKRFHTRQRK